MCSRKLVLGVLIISSILITNSFSETIQVSKDTRSDCGYIKSLHMKKGTDGKTYAIIVTSIPQQITATSNWVGGNYYMGGSTCIVLSTDAVEKALVWASLDRALQNNLIHFYWRTATISNTPFGDGIWYSMVTDWTLGTDVTGNNLPNN